MGEDDAKPKDPTAQPRKALERQRKRGAGLVPIEIWTRPEHKESIRKYAQQLNKSELTGLLGVHQNRDENQ